MINKYGNRVTLEAKVTGPLMSMTASGAFGGALVFGKWKGRPTVHQLVFPANPRSTTQAFERNIMRVTGADQHWANVSIMKAPGEPLTDKQRLINIAPSGFAWNGNFVRAMTGIGNITYNAARAAYAALTGAQKIAWDAAAAALLPALPPVAQKLPFTNEAAPAVTAGEAWFIYQYGLFALGLELAPGGVPPAYA